MKKFRPTADAVRLLLEGTIAFAQIEHDGVRVDKEYIDAAIIDADRRVADMEAVMRADPVYDAWRRRHPNPNLASPAQLADVVFGELGYKPAYATVSGERASAAEKALSGVDLPFVRTYFAAQKIRKARGTYLGGIVREMVRDECGLWWVHPVYHLNSVTSYRSSVSDPPWQTNPIRNPEMARLVRRSFVPRPGYHIMQMDYCLHPDTLIKTVCGDRRIGDIVAGDKVLSLRDGRIWWSVVTHSGDVGKMPSYRVTFDNGESVIASARHRWPVRVKPPNPKGSKVTWAAGGRVVVEKTTAELAVGDRMIPCRTVCNKRNGYEHLYSASAFKYTKTHKLVADAVYGACPVGYETHHRDGDKTNNHPDNLEYREAKQHQSEHAKEKWRQMSAALRRKKIRDLQKGLVGRPRSGKDNPNYGNRKGPEVCCLYCGKSFYAPPCCKQVYCDRSCYDAARRDGLNHKIVSVEFVGEQSSHGITVEPDHNYVLSCGVVTCNSQQEVRTACAHTQDPELIRYMTDPSTDMHRDMAAQIYFLEESQVPKELRQLTKAAFVFASFYGSYYVQTAPPLWEGAVNMTLPALGGITVREHLAANGITRLGACKPKERPVSGTFEARIKDIEEDFWGRRFKVYAQWKRDWVDAYRKRGGCLSLTGFPMMGPHSKNDITNYVNQGDAFHLTLWSVIRLVKRFRRYKMKSRVIGEIHDSVEFDVHPRERDDVIDMAVSIMTKEVLEYAPWVNVPLVVETDLCPIDAPWVDKMPLKQDGGYWVPANGDKWTAKYGSWEKQVA